MKNLFTKFKESSRETKQFLITVIILFIIVIGTFLFAYFRINFVRSGNVKQETQIGSRLTEIERVYGTKC
jgi:uncharacterized membrane protein